MKNIPSNLLCSAEDEVPTVGDEKPTPEDDGTAVLDEVPTPEDDGTANLDEVLTAEDVGTTVMIRNNKTYNMTYSIAAELSIYFNLSHGKFHLLYITNLF